MSLTSLLAAARLAHAMALLLLLGLAVFPAPAQSSGAYADVRAWRQRRFGGLAALALASGLAWFALTTANMSGVPHDAVDPAAWHAMVGETAFGKIWAGRMGLGLVLCAVALARPGATAAIAGLCGLELCSLAATGHAGLPDGLWGRLHQVADGVHLLAAGLWIGALWALARMVARHPAAEETETALRRFSGAGQLAVALLVATGLVNTGSILDALSQLVSTLYGRLLLLKLAAFAGMVGLAGLNRFVLVPRLATGPQAARQLRRHILGEQALAVLVVGIVAVIGTLDPAA